MAPRKTRRPGRDRRSLASRASRRAIDGDGARRPEAAPLGRERQPCACAALDARPFRGVSAALGAVHAVPRRDKVQLVVAELLARRGRPAVSTRLVGFLRGDDVVHVATRLLECEPRVRIDAGPICGAKPGIPYAAGRGRRRLSSIRRRKWRDTLAASGRSRTSSPSSMLRSSAASVKFAEVTNTASSSVTTALALEDGSWAFRIERPRVVEHSGA